MIDPREVIELVNQHVNRTLTVAEAALPPEQFKAFRKLMLDEFGHRGLASELLTLLQDKR